MNFSRFFQTCTRGQVPSMSRSLVPIGFQPSIKNSATALHRGTFYSISNKAGPDGKPGPEELPKFSLQQLGISPRARFWIRVSLVTLALMEGATWVKIWPKITGSGQQGSSD